MPILDICRMGNPVLRVPTEDYPEHLIPSEELNQLLEDMHDSMLHYGGIGIAAPQLGISQKVTIIELQSDNERYEVEEDEEQELLVIINPQITVLDKTLQGFWEGCLSLPGLRGFVERPRKIQLDYLDQTGKKQTLVAEDFFATVIQHELDHLFGNLYIDHIKDTKLISYEEEFDQFLAKEEK